MHGLFDRLQSEIDTRQRVEGLSMADLLEFPPELRRIINMILRRGEMSLGEIALEVDMRPSEVRGLLDVLAEKGYLRVFEVEGEKRYKTFLAHRRSRDVPLSIWEALGSKME